MLKNERDARYPETFALVCSIEIRNRWLVYVNDSLERLLKFRWPVIAVLSDESVTKRSDISIAPATPKKQV